MQAHEWYDNYYCKKCKREVHENHNIPKHICVEGVINESIDDVVWFISCLTGLFISCVVMVLISLIRIFT